jgi:DNA repair protein RecN (Recombination protein N)
VPLKSLKELGERAINIYGQHAHQTLMQARVQRELIDRFAGHKNKLAKLKELYTSWRELKEKYDTLSINSKEMEATIELLRYQVQELDQLSLQPGELDELEHAHNRLSNAEALKKTAIHAYYQLDNDESSDLCSQLGVICKDISALSANDPELAKIYQSLEEASILLNENASDLRNYADAIEVNPEELTNVEQRLSLIDNIARKHKISPDEIIQLHTDLSEELAKYSEPDFDLDALHKLFNETEKEYRALAAQISKARKSAAKKISTEVTQALAKLGMEKARLQVKVDTQSDAAPSSYGLDHIEFLVQTNPGQKLSSLAHVASGGELSRISLAIQMIAVDKLDVPVIIFDEVDSGVGGAIAEVVGIELQNISHNRQVFCITHLPQVAAKGHTHYRVNKQSDNAKTSATIENLDSAQRITEIARMLGGVKLTENTYLHAREMLESHIQ